MVTEQPSARWRAARALPSRRSALRGIEIAVAALFTLLLMQAALRFNPADPALWSAYWPAFSRGVVGTLRYLAILLPLSVAVGFVLGWARVTRYRVLSWPVAVYVNFFRGVPLILIVIFASLIGPAILGSRFPGRDTALTVVAVAISLHSAAFQAEIFRAGFQSVPRGQLEAALSIGLRPSQSMQHVLLPQALRLTLPPLSNELAVLIKDSSLLAVIGAVDLFGVSQDFSQEILFTPNAPLSWVLSVWTAVAVTYLVMTSATTGLLSWIERRYRVKGLEAVSV